MKKMKILKKVSGIVLSVALLMSMGATKMTVLADTDQAAVSRKAGEKVTESIEKAITMAVMRAIVSGSERGNVKLDGRLLDINTLSRDTIVQLNDCNVDAEFSFDYKGYHYVINIPAGTAPLNDDVLWYGPMYLMSLYWETAVVTLIE